MGVVTSTVSFLRLADERTRDRRGDRDLAVAHARLEVADDLVFDLLVGVLVDERDGGAELDRVAGQLRGVDDIGAADAVLELGDPRLVQALRLLGGVILGVLRQVAMLHALPRSAE